MKFLSQLDPIDYLLPQNNCLVVATQDDERWILRQATTSIGNFYIWTPLNVATARQGDRSGMKIEYKKSWFGLYKKVYTYTSDTALHDHREFHSAINEAIGKNYNIYYGNITTFNELNLSK